MRADPKPTGVIYNRAQTNSTSHQSLEDLLRCLDIPVIAELKDSAVYAKAAQYGAGVMEMRENIAASREYDAWRDIMIWIDRRTAGRRELPGLFKPVEKLGALKSARTESPNKPH